VDRRVLFDLALLRYIGCTSHAHEVSVAFGDEIGARRHFLGFDFADRRATGRAVVTMAGAGRSLPGRLATVVATLAAGRIRCAKGFGRAARSPTRSRAAWDIRTPCAARCSSASSGGTAWGSRTGPPA